MPIKNLLSLSSGKSQKLYHVTVHVAKSKSKMFEAFTRNQLQSFKDLVVLCHDVEGAPTTEENEIKHPLETYSRHNLKDVIKRFWN